VSAGTIVAAKLAALAAYVLLIAAAMHAIGAVFFGSILGTRSSGVFVLRGIFAHLAAASAASAWVALMVAAAQGLTLALAGPRIFRRAAILLQIGLVGLMAVGLALLPVMAFSAVHTLRGFGGRMQPWVLSTPPLWFLGLYEWLLGTSDPVLLGLARNAGLTLLGAIAVTLITYPVAYRRLMVSVVERGDGPGRNPAARVMRACFVRVAGRHPEARAAADFYLATLARVERHRFVLAMALGISVAWVVVVWKMMDAPAELEAVWLSLPLSAMIFLVAGLRIAASLPGDIRGAWLFELKEPSRAHARQALERAMFLLGVLPPSLLAAPIFWWLWGRDVALIHTAVALALGAAVVEWLIWHCDGMPCGQRWTLARANLGYRWPVYVAAFFLVTIGIPKLELLVVADRSRAAVFVAVLLCAAWSVRHFSSKHVIEPSYDEVDPVAGVLRLN
jgi:hypothetical protein